MGELLEKHTIFGPFPDADPVDTALLFLRTNRYRVIEQVRGPAPPGLLIDRSLGQPPDEPQDEPQDEAEVEPQDEAEVEPQDEAEVEPEDNDLEICLRAELVRGEKWSGLLGSSMADLPTTLTIVLEGNILRAEYAVTTTGQILSASEREFWKNEARALEQYVKGTGELFSLASAESERAVSARRDLLGTGLAIAGIVFFIVFVAGVIYVRM